MGVSRHSLRVVVHRALRAVLDGEIDQIEALYAGDIRLHNQPANAPDGLAGVRERALLFTSALWEATLSVDHYHENGDLVATRWSAHGTHRGWLFGAAPSGQHVRMRATSLMRVRGGRVVEDWTQYGRPEQAPEYRPLVPAPPFVTSEAGLLALP